MDTTTTNHAAVPNLFRYWDTASSDPHRPLGTHWVRGEPQAVTIRGETGYAVPWWFMDGTGMWGSDAALLGVDGFEIARGVSDVRAVLDI